MLPRSLVATLLTIGLGFPTGRGLTTQTGGESGIHQNEPVGRAASSAKTGRSVEPARLRRAGHSVPLTGAKRTRSGRRRLKASDDGTVRKANFYSPTTRVRGDCIGRSYRFASLRDIQATSKQRS